MQTFTCTKEFSSDSSVKLSLDLLLPQLTGNNKLNSSSLSISHNLNNKAGIQLLREEKRIHINLLL